MIKKEGETNPKRVRPIPAHSSSLSPGVQKQLQHKEKPLSELGLYFISYRSGGRQSFIFA